MILCSCRNRDAAPVTLPQGVVIELCPDCWAALAEALEVTTVADLIDPQEWDDLFGGAT